jgi:hypothetical protein
MKTKNDPTIMTSEPHNIVTMSVSYYFRSALSFSSPLLQETSLSLPLLCILNGLVRESISLAVSFACHELESGKAVIEPFQRFLGFVVALFEVLALPL